MAILTNGGGLGVLAVDRLADLGGDFSALSATTLAKLDRILPAAWSHANPVDIIGDADAVRYVAALEVLLDDGASDAVLVLQIPTALAASEETARAVAACVAQHKSAGLKTKPVFAVWLGADEAVALPPLDRRQACDLIAHTHIARRLEPYRNVPGVDRAALEAVLIRLAELAADLPQIEALDFNPLLADAHAVVAVDARVMVVPRQGDGDAIHVLPYTHTRGNGYAPS